MNLKALKSAAAIVALSLWPAALTVRAQNEPLKAMEGQPKAMEGPAGAVEGPAGAKAASPAAASGTDEYGIPLVSIRSNALPMPMVAERIKEQTGVTIIATGKAAQDKVTVLADNEPLIQVLDKIIAGKDWQWHRVDERTFEIMDTATYLATVLPKQIREATIVPENLKATEVAKAIDGMMNKKIGESVTADDRTNKIFLRALPQTIEAVQKFIREIDRSFVTRVFRVKYADTNFIAEKITELKSDPGTITVDEINHQIIVRDQFRNIRRMEFLIDIYDRRPTMRIYQLNNLKYQGENLNTILAVIERVITPGAFIEVNAERGMIILEDIEEVHERVAKLISVFDESPKQAMIYAEIIETTFNQGYNFGLDAQFSNDLRGVAADGLFSSLIPKGKDTAADNKDFGFRDLKGEFPTAQTGSGGIGIEYLSRNAHLVFAAAMSKSDTRVLSQPRVIVENQERAHLTVGGSVAYRTTLTYSTVNVTQERSLASVPEGIDLDVQVSITHDEVCELDININNTAASLRGDPNDPLVDTTRQSVETILRVPSGETSVIGGLLSRNDSTADSGVPLVGQIPWIGPLLFGKRINSSQQKNLLVFITPVVLKSEKRGRRPALSIDELTAMTEEEAGQTTEGAATGPATQKDFYKSLQNLLEQAGKARKGETSYRGAEAEAPKEEAPEQKEAVPPATPAEKEAPAEKGAPAKPRQMVPKLPEEETESKTEATTETKAQLTGKPLEPLKRPKAEEATAEGKPEMPESSFEYQPAGAIGSLTGKGKVTTGGAKTGRTEAGRPAITPRPVVTPIVTPRVPSLMPPRPGMESETRY